MTALEKQFFDAFNIGFDHLMDRATKAPTYPPYNLIKTGETTYLIEMAVAGFGEDDLEITVEDSKLKVVGTNSGVDEDAEYLHKGIASRPFTHTFTLAEHVEVEDVVLDNGILTIRLHKIVPEAKMPKKIPVNRPYGKSFLQE